MILTVTMNPSIDMAYIVPSFTLDQVQRADNVHKVAGGKGLNVTKVLHQLGTPVKATGLIGGRFGQFITDQLTQEAILHDFIEIEEDTRHSIAILHNNQQTEILEPGPTISKIEAEKFLAHFPDLLNDVQVLTISGSLPKGLTADFYEKLIQMANERDIKVLFDSSGSTLIQILENENRPFLIKPNDDEIKQITGKAFDLQDLETCKQELNSPIFKGIEWIVISMGSKGAFIKRGDQFYRAHIPTIQVVSPVGSGDSTIAGLAFGLLNQDSDEIIIKTAMTTGILNTMEAQTGHINPANFDAIYQQIQIEKI